MKAKNILMTALAATIIAWLLAPFLSLYPQLIYREFVSSCQVNPKDTKEVAKEKSDECAKFFAMQGQSGDLFGTATSLFSGLALFGVAFTLYADLAYRRKERKPLLACSPSEAQALSFAKPTEADPKSFYLVGTMKVSSICETALNSRITPELSIDSQWFKLRELAVGMPIQASKELQVDLSDILPKEAIDVLCKNNREMPEMRLRIVCKCTNLDGEEFSSEVTYKIDIQFEDYLPKIMSMRHNGPKFDGSWDDRAGLLLKWEFQPGSWKFSSP